MSRHNLHSVFLPHCIYQTTLKLVSVPNGQCCLQIEDEEIKKLLQSSLKPKKKSGQKKAAKKSAAAAKQTESNTESKTESKVNTNGAAEDEVAK